MTKRCITLPRGPWPRSARRRCRNWSKASAIRMSASGLLTPRLVGDAASRALSQIGAAAVPAVLQLLQDPDPSWRRRGLWILGGMGGEAEAAVPVLIGGLQDADPEWRWEIASHLFSIGPRAKPAIPAVTRALKDRSSKVRIMAAKALKKIDPANRAALAAVLGELRDRSGDAGRREAVRA